MMIKEFKKVVEIFQKEKITQRSFLEFFQNLIGTMNLKQLSTLKGIATRKKTILRMKKL